MKSQNETVFFYAGIVVVAVTALFLFDALFSKHLAYLFPFVSYGGTFRWHSIKIANMKISLYWSAYIIGIALMAVLCMSRRKLCKLSIAKSITTAILLVVFGFIGAKILFLLENRTALQQGEIQMEWGGVSFFGTVFFMPIVIPIAGKFLKIEPFTYLDFCTPAGILMLACIRCGCFMGGCCRGIIVWVIQKPLIFPVQLMESMLDLFLLNYILKLEKKHQFEHGRYVIFMGGYGAIRFLLEFIRDTPKKLLGLSNGQAFSVVCMVIAIGYLIAKRRKGLVNLNEKMSKLWFH